MSANAPTVIRLNGFGRTSSVGVMISFSNVVSLQCAESPSSSGTFV
jgi:hypothetical protein